MARRQAAPSLLARATDCPRVVCVRGHKPVNVHHTGEKVKLSLCNDYHSVLLHWSKPCTYYPVDESSLRTRTKKRKKLLLLIIYCLKEWDTFVVLLRLLRVFYLFLNGYCFKLRFIMFPNGALCGECLLCAVTCCRTLCMKSVQASKHVTGILLFKG